MAASRLSFERTLRVSFVNALHGAVESRDFPRASLLASALLPEARAEPSVLTAAARVLHAAASALPESAGGGASARARLTRALRLALVADRAVWARGGGRYLSARVLEDASCGFARAAADEIARGDAAALGLAADASGPAVKRRRTARAAALRAGLRAAATARALVRTLLVWPAGLARGSGVGALAGLDADGEHADGPRLLAPATREARAAADEQLTSDDVLHDPFFLSVAALAALADAQVEGGVRVGFADGRVAAGGAGAGARADVGVSARARSRSGSGSADSDSPAHESDDSTSHDTSIRGSGTRKKSSKPRKRAREADLPSSATATATMACDGFLPPDHSLLYAEERARDGVLAGVGAVGAGAGDVATGALREAEDLLARAGSIAIRALKRALERGEDAHDFNAAANALADVVRLHCAVLRALGKERDAKRVASDFVNVAM